MNLFLRVPDSFHRFAHAGTLEKRFQKLPDLSFLVIDVYSLEKEITPSRRLLPKKKPIKRVLEEKFLAYKRFQEKFLHPDMKSYNNSRYN